MACFRLIEKDPSIFSGFYLDSRLGSRKRDPHRHDSLNTVLSHCFRFSIFVLVNGNGVFYFLFNVLSFSPH